VEEERCRRNVVLKVTWGYYFIEYKETQ